MALPDRVAALAAQRRYTNQVTAYRARGLMRAQWGRVNPVDPVGSWETSLGPLAGRVMRAAQLAAAHGAQEYVTDVLRAQGIDPEAAGRVPPDAFMGTTSDGDDLDGLLQLPAETAQFTLDRGKPPAEALDAGRKQLDLIVSTQVGDAARVPVGVATVAARHAEGYVRMLTPPSCSRCVLLAGKWYASNDGFKRHPNCDCVHVPSTEDVGRHWTTDPHTYFDRLTVTEQNNVFTQAGAQAIRDGADIFQTVNARQIIRSTTIAGRPLKTSGIGVTKRSLAGSRLSEGGKRRVVRLMPESIYQIAGDDRDELLRLLHLHGYIL